MPTDHAARPVHRFEVSAKPGREDPRAQAVARDAAWLGVRPASVRTARVYLVQADLTDEQRRRLAAGLLGNPVLDEVVLGASPAARGAQVVEVHPLPGVMDPAAQTVREAAMDLIGVDAAVSTGERFDFEGVTAAQADMLAQRLLANPVIQRATREPFHPADLPRGSPYVFRLVRVPLRDLSDADLERLSREAHLFLDPHEMRAVRDHYRALGRDPTDIELETLAQTWSEHCVHKTLKSTVTYRSVGTHVPVRGLDAPDPAFVRPGHAFHPDGSVTIRNLLKSTVAAATFELIADGVDWTLSVFKDNAGVVAFDENTAVNIKVETHNHPSAIEPYGGAATGVGGCIRDVIATGLGAKPIANTDVFCVAHPDRWAEAGAAGGAPLPRGVIHPRRVLQRVVAGVRDYGNRMGIPTVSGAVDFDDRYIGNPLVFCGCVGVMRRDLIEGRARPGDLIVALGGRTGRDGIHGATFSSTELTDTHADEFAHAVQIGNAIEEKRLLDAVLRARDAQGGPLYTALTDCGAGGFSSAVGEMAAALGAEVHLDRAPLKYDGLSYTEIWISEAQERLVLAVPPDRLARLQAICDEERVELAVLGTFGDPGRDLVLRFRGEEVGRLSMAFLHDGLPTPTRDAHWTAPVAAPTPRDARATDFGAALRGLLAAPAIASKRWIIRQYDHEVQSRTVVKPLVGPRGEGPSDAAVLTPVPGSPRGLAISQGLCTGLGDPAVGGDPYLMALGAVDECARNLVCVGANPERIAILDNFSWPSCRKPQNLAALVRAAAGCYDAAKAFRTPFVSGKDSLNNQFTTEDGRTIEIPFTLLITGMGVVDDRSACVTSDMKRPGSALVLVGETGAGLGGSHAQRLLGGASPVPVPDPVAGAANARAVADVLRRGLAVSAHDCSDGGLLVAVAEMLIGAHAGVPREIGAVLDLSLVQVGGDPGDSRDPEAGDNLAACFAETPSRYVLETPTERLAELQMALSAAPGVCSVIIGRTDDTGRLRVSRRRHALLDEPVEALKAAWTGTLDW